jgi:hypothetical protein
MRMPRHDLLNIDCSDFVPDPHYLDLVCFRLFEQANEIVTAYGGFFITTLRNQFSTMLTQWLSQGGIPVVNASLVGKEYTSLPDDAHPNALAHQFYAKRIRDYLLRYLAEHEPDGT